MYTDYWQLETKPFEPGPEPQFVFPSESFQAATHKLRYAIESGRGAALLAGAAGVGKTLLVDALKEQLDDRYRPIASVVFPLMSPDDLLAYLAEQLGAQAADPARYTVEESLRRLEFFFAENRRQSRHAVVVVDDAHMLEDTGMFDSLRSLLNLQIDGQPAFTLLLVGDSSLPGTVERFTALDQRIAMKVLLGAFSPEDTAGYVQHRLQAAGATREIFAPDAIAVVHELSWGIPRRINRLCDLALLVAFGAGEPTVTAKQLHAVSNELISLSQAA